MFNERKHEATKCWQLHVHWKVGKYCPESTLEMISKYTKGFRMQFYCFVANKKRANFVVKSDIFL